MSKWDAIRDDEIADLRARVAELEREQAAWRKFTDKANKTVDRAEAALADAVSALHEIAHAHDREARQLRMMAADALIAHNLGIFAGQQTTAICPTCGKTPQPYCDLPECGMP
jgi:predicted  nucleic acid-binding Zn-ribbon protein